MKIVIVGTGYVGLVSGACFAESGIEVVCVDIDQNKIENLKQGIIPIFEPGLEEIVKRNIKHNRLHFSTNLADSLPGCEAAFIAVGTPPGEDGSADLQYVLKVAEQIGTHMQGYLVVVTKSTVPVTTSEKVKTAVYQALLKRGCELEFDVASNPEFLKEGAAVNDFLKPDRIVIGVESNRAQEVMQKLYAPFVLNGHPTIFMDVRSAEMTKYAANAMLATKISFMNDIANLCELTGVDVNSVRKGIGSDDRIGNRFIYPGAGYGGSCFPKDVKALIRTANEYGYNMQVLHAVEAVNEKQKSVLVEKLKRYFNNDLKGKHIAVWGLAFKPNTDDVREAPALSIIHQLIELGAHVHAYDPVAAHEASKYLSSAVQFANESYDALTNADALVIVTEWQEFRTPDFNRIITQLKHPVIFDGRNLYDLEEMKSLGFHYESIGRKVIA